MATLDDMGAAVDRVSARLELTDWQRTVLGAIGGLTAQGFVTAQVAPVSVLPSKDGEDDEAQNEILATLFAQGFLAWKTSKGWNYGRDARNPATGRRFGAATMFMTTRAVEHFGAALHALLMEPLDAADDKRPRVRGIVLGSYLASLSRGTAPAPPDDAPEP